MSIDLRKNDLEIQVPFDTSTEVSNGRKRRLPWRDTGSSRRKSGSLTDAKICQVGQSKVSVLIVGKTEEGDWAGLKTKPWRPSS